MKVLLIIPAYNEQDNIVNTINDIKKNAEKVDYIIINDCSKDKTLEVCIKNKFNYISLVHNLGIGGAVQTGYKYAFDNEYDIAIQFDGDGQHDARYIDTIIQPIINEKADIVIGSRFIEIKSKFISSKLRRAGIKTISAVMKLLTAKKIYDVTSGFRACNKKAIALFAKDYPFEYPEPVSTTIALKRGYKVEEIAVEMREREFGTSSIKAWKNVYYMINVLLSLLIVSIRRYKR